MSQNIPKAHTVYWLKSRKFAFVDLSFSTLKNSPSQVHTFSKNKRGGRESITADVRERGGEEKNYSPRSLCQILQKMRNKGGESGGGSNKSLSLSCQSEKERIIMKEMQEENAANGACLHSSSPPLTLENPSRRGEAKIISFRVTDISTRSVSFACQRLWFLADGKRKNDIHNEPLFPPPLSTSQ